jgi:uncharacterized protein YbjT (DUF2867 family)
MKILFTGATGVLGRSAVPQLVTEGHDVTAIARTVIGVLDGQVIGAVALEVLDGKVVTVRAILNPDKLSHLAETG